MSGVGKCSLASVLYMVQYVINAKKRRLRPENDYALPVLCAKYRVRKKLLLGLETYLCVK